MAVSSHAGRNAIRGDEKDYRVFLRNGKTKSRMETESIQQATMATSTNLALTTSSSYGLEGVSPELNDTVAQAGAHHPQQRSTRAIQLPPKTNQLPPKFESSVKEKDALLTFNSQDGYRG